ncbi:MAG: hypothetical protein NTX16_02215 [Actinobacteria bacterium]|nr:hypothetical protein [Actinomycetota bacterium]
MPAVTNTQPVLDAVPQVGATDLRKSRGALGNVVRTSTNAAALEQVMPEIGRIGFMDLRVPSGAPGAGAECETVRRPLTHVKIFGWYDNEMGSHTHRLGQLTMRIAKSL